MREINIEDYFQLLDTSQELNERGFEAKEQMKIMFSLRQITPWMFDDKGGKEEELGGSFGHFFVKEGGGVMIEGGEGKVKLSKGASCFVPEIVGNIKIKSETEESVILKTYIPINDGFDPPRRAGT